MSCENCKNPAECEDNGKREPASVPYYSVESERYYARRSMRWVVASFCMILVFIALCIGFCYKVNRDCLDKVEAMNKYWIDYISQYDFEDYTVDLSTDGGGNASYIGANGDIYNGTSGSSQESTEAEERQGER